MNINKIGYYINPAIDFIQSKISVQNKKIYAIAAVWLGLIATCYIILRCYSGDSKKKLTHSNEPKLPNREPLPTNPQKELEVKKEAQKKDLLDDGDHQLNQQYEEEKGIQPLPLPQDQVADLAVEMHEEEELKEKIKPLHPTKLPREVQAFKDTHPIPPKAQEVERQKTQERIPAVRQAAAAPAVRQAAPAAVMQIKEIDDLLDPKDAVEADLENIMMIKEIDGYKLEIGEKIYDGYLARHHHGKYEDRPARIVNLSDTHHLFSFTLAKNILKEFIDKWNNINHFHLVKLFGYHIGTEENKRLELVAEPIGPNFEDYHENLTISDRVKIALDVAKGLKEIHRSSYRHGSLTPRSIFINLKQKSLEAKLFYCSEKEFEKVFNYYRMDINDILYSSPEQFQIDAAKITPQSDIYAFGTVLYSVFGGKFQAKSLMEATVRPLNVEKPANCPDSIWDLINKCWAMDPQDRPSADDLISDLSEIRKQEFRQVAPLPAPAAVLQPKPLVNQADDSADLASLMTIGQIDGNKLFVDKEPLPHFHKKVANFHDGTYANRPVRVLKLNWVNAYSKAFFNKFINRWNQINHFHLVKFLGFHVGNDHQELELLIEKTGPHLRGEFPNDLTVKDRIKIALDVAKGLKEVHEIHYHGDLTPESIFINRTPQSIEAKLLYIDEREFLRGTENNAIRVTDSLYPMLFSSPELFSSAPPTKASDIYAFGMVLWTLFEEKAPTRTLKDMANNTSLARPANCPDSIWNVITKCWADDPINRPSVVDLISSLEEAGKL